MRKPNISSDCRLRCTADSSSRPAHRIGEIGSYIGFVLEVMPLIHAANVARRETPCDRTILYLVQVGLAALCEGQELPSTRSLALDLLAQVRDSLRLQIHAQAQRIVTADQ